jgi:hypothetical protein
MREQEGWQMADVYIESLTIYRDRYEVSGQVNVGQGSKVEFNTELTEEESEELEKLFLTIGERFRNEIKNTFAADDD